MSLTAEEVYKMLRELWKFPDSITPLAPTEATAEVTTDEPIYYIKARMNEKTMEVEVADHGIWISLDTYRRQRRLNEEEFMPKARGIVSTMPWKSGVEMPKDAKKFFERIGDPSASKKSEEKPEPEEPLKNYCAPRRMFSQCKAGKTWKAHQGCRFSVKATRYERCMYFRNLNGTKHCDNHKAQKALYLSAKDGRLVPNG